VRASPVFCTLITIDCDFASASSTTLREREGEEGEVVRSCGGDCVRDCEPLQSMNSTVY
jgi:hypothetical protein